MSLFFDVFLIVISFTIFAILHTLTASTKLKVYVKDNYPDYLAFYRIGFNLFSLFSFYLFLSFAPKPDNIVFDLPNPYDLFTLPIQLFSIFGFIWSIKYFNNKEFLGIAQISRHLKKDYDKNELDEHKTLNINGPYKFSRHPIYFFSIVFLMARPYMTVFYLTTLICIIIYFYIGSYYEEKKLVITFGELYTGYQKKVARIIPYLF